MLHDKQFKWIAHVSADTPAATKEAALRYLVFPCGLVRGALTSLGVDCVVRADFPDGVKPPACTFHVRIKS